MALATLAQVRTYLGLKPTETASDVQIQAALDSASAEFERECQRTFAVANYVDTLDGDGSMVIIPRAYPIVSITSLTIDGVTEVVSAAFDEQGYYLADDGCVHLRWRRLPEGTGNVVLSYSAGYATIPVDIVQAVVELTAYRFKTRDHLTERTRSSADNTSVTFLIDSYPPSVQKTMDAHKDPLN